jgi:rhodanese-related sulfurtransferase
MKSVEPFDFAKYGAQTEIIRPILQNGEFSVASYASIENAIEKYKGKNILIFCSSGNRAAATLAIYLNTKLKAWLLKKQSIQSFRLD